MTTTVPSPSQAPSGPPPGRAQLIRALQANWRREMDGARTYHELAAKEPDPGRAAILRRLADAEERHADRCAARLHELGAPVPTVFRTPLDRVRAWVRGQVGTDAALRQLEHDEKAHVADYRAQMQAIPDAQFHAMLDEMQAEEQVHSKVLYSMGRQAGPRNALDALLRRERWHVQGGGWLGDAIYGANDGLGAVFGIVSGVAGATAGGSPVLIAGLAGMIASALSMGSGAYLATKSEREVYEAELERERGEIAAAPDEEREEMELFYQLKGFTPEEAALLTDRLAQDPEHLLTAMAHEELGISQHGFPSPVLAAVSAAISTGIGAFIPIIPFFFMRGYAAIIAAAAISLVAHFAVGAAKTFVTGRSLLASGMEMTVVGAIEGLITYLIGLTLGPLAG
ncbi:MAG TPA: VIT1/CCC1 transporter family protein [Chloroflexia bacterium]|nr:VIT1/CCC1 transporter family protein [Chloroflexia bacterium]